MPIRLCMALLALTSCTPQPWVTVGGPHTLSQHGLTVDLPPGWVRSTATDDAVFITRDGAVLQLISIQLTPVEKELFHAKKMLSASLLLEEVVQIVIDNILLDRDITHQQIIENHPANFAGHSGFKLHYTYLTNEGLPRSVIRYGAITGKNLLLVSYEAPSRHYFPQALPLFEGVRESIRLKAS